MMDSAYRADATPLIELANICKSYGGRDGAPAVEVLHGIDLSIGAGEFIAIVGASGSGKSPLMHILGCLDQPSSGSYRFAGQDIAAFSADQLAQLRREAFGLVFQGYHLISTLDASHNVQARRMGRTEGETHRLVAIQLLAHQAVCAFNQAEPAIGRG